MPNKSHLKKLFRYWPAALLALLGAAGGYAYYHFVGCASGACMITSNPVLTTLYGGVLGGLIGVIVTPDKKEASAHE